MGKGRNPAIYTNSYPAVSYGDRYNRSSHAHVSLYINSNPDPGYVNIGTTFPYAFTSRHIYGRAYIYCDTAVTNAGGNPDPSDLHFEVG